MNISFTQYFSNQYWVVEFFNFNNPISGIEASLFIAWFLVTAGILISYLYINKRSFNQKYDLGSWAFLAAIISVAGCFLSSKFLALDIVKYSFWFKILGGFLLGTNLYLISLDSRSNGIRSSTAFIQSVFLLIGCFLVLVAVLAGIEISFYETTVAQLVFSCLGLMVNTYCPVFCNIVTDLWTRVSRKTDYQSVSVFYLRQLADLAYLASLFSLLSCTKALTWLTPKLLNFLIQLENLGLGGHYEGLDYLKLIYFVWGGLCFFLLVLLSKKLLDNAFYAITASLPMEPLIIYNLCLVPFLRVRVPALRKLLDKQTAPSSTVLAYVLKNIVLKDLWLYRPSLADFQILTIVSKKTGWELVRDVLGITTIFLGILETTAAPIQSHYKWVNLQESRRKAALLCAFLRENEKSQPKNLVSTKFLEDLERQTVVLQSAPNLTMAEEASSAVNQSILHIGKSHGITSDKMASEAITDVIYQLQEKLL